ncbi:hypothetical protein FACS1894103_0950 [Campylobacterota bacterium]|nr:hypothetical protein FACS1894103_0950 [Campylobacterota bacterium]
MSDRFAFGKNWERFLSTLEVDQIEDAKRALVKLIGTDDLKGKSFLDIGSGSGLHSLAAFLLGAKVHSFDYDTDSVRCTQALQSRYGNDDWTVEQGSALDSDYLAKLGEFDLVYSWGVLHHTGDMKTALELAGKRVKTGGTLAIAIYNTQLTTPFWKIVKRCYVKSPNWLKVVGGGGMDWLFCRLSIFCGSAQAAQPACAL